MNIHLCFQKPPQRSPLPPLNLCPVAGSGVPIPDSLLDPGGPASGNGPAAPGMACIRCDGDDDADPSDDAPPPPPPTRRADIPPSMKADFPVRRGSNLEDETPPVEEDVCGNSGCSWLPSGPEAVGEVSD